MKRFKRAENGLSCWETSEAVKKKKKKTVPQSPHQQITLKMLGLILSHDCTNF